MAYLVFCGVDFSLCCVYIINLTPTVISKTETQYLNQRSFCNIISNNASSGLRKNDEKGEIEHTST